MFAGTKVHRLDVISSDHKALWISLEHMNCSFQKPFRFEQIWMSEKGCSDTAKAMWNINSTKSWDTHILRKIEKCGAALSGWSKKSFGSIKKQLEVAHKQLKATEQHALWSGDSSYIRFLEDEVNQLLNKEAQMWKQQSKVAWLRDGDCNTQFFHSKASQCRKRNYITKLHDANRGWCSSEDQVHTTIVDFYQTLFTSSSLNNFEVIKNVPQVVIEEMNDMLVAEVTIEEVEIALK